MADPATFAKLFDTPHGQFLVTLSCDEDEFYVYLRGADRHDISPEMKWTYEREEEQRSAFDSFSEADALRLALSMAMMVDHFGCRMGRARPMAEKIPTPRAAEFLAANAQSPVVAGRLIEPNPNKPPKGIIYQLDDGRLFRLGVKDARSIPMPRWKESGE